MKRILLLITGSILVVSSQAQNIKIDPAYSNVKKIPFASATATQQAKVPALHSSARTTASTFYSEDFSSGTHTSLPTGWTAGVIAGPGTWHWTTTASTSAYTLGTIASTTASNGWMIFDSDSLGTNCSCAPGGWLQSPVINCATHTSVKLSFQEKYREFYDSCFIQVSNNGGTSWTSFKVLPNDGLGTNTSTANPQVVNVNISSVAASQAAVLIRFVYNGDGATDGGYSWLIDDINVSELDPHDVGISGSFMYEPEATAYNGSIFTTPLAFVDSVFPVTLLTNYGANAETGVSLNATIYSGTSSVYTQPSTYATLPVSAYDTSVQFPGYKPNAVGNYTCTFSAAITGDAVTTNNVDTVLFNVSDTTWQENLGDVTGGYYLYDAATHASYLEGTRFDVPSSSAGDTVSGFGVAFSSSSVPTNAGGTVKVQLYSVQQSSGGWNYVASSVSRAITAADISTASLITWADFRIDPAVSGGISAFVLQPGTTYAAMVQIDGVTTNLLVDATDAPNATGFSGYFGQSDTSSNDGAASFSPGSVATGNPSSVPLVRMYFGPIPQDHTGINNLNYSASVGNPYPNPANTSVFIPFISGQDANVTATLSNAIGQVVRTQSVTATAGQSAKVTFATNNLPDGIYLYSMDIGGQHTTGRIAVTH